jgi:hypothetical protein
MHNSPVGYEIIVELLVRIERRLKSSRFLLEASNGSAYCVHTRTPNLRSELEYNARRMRISGDLLAKPHVLIGSSVTPDLRHLSIHCLCLGISDTNTRILVELD